MEEKVPLLAIVIAKELFPAMDNPFASLMELYLTITDFLQEN